MTKTKVVICPYCGDTQPTGERCRACGGFFEPLSRQATHNAMGPWFMRDESRPFQPGCSYETLVRMIERAQINKYSIIRGPTTKQFWTVAKHVPGVSHLLGYCHNCDASVDAGDHGCHACGVPFGAYLDRNFLGLPDIRPLPWEAGHEEQRAREPASSRTLEFRRAAEPLGISSFASDDELRGSGVTPVHAYGVHSTAPVAGGTSPALMLRESSEWSATTPQPMSVETDEAAERSLTGATARAMQRRVARQQRTIRLLSVIVLVMAALSLVTLVVIVLANQAASEPPTETDRSEAVTNDRAAGSSTHVPQAVDAREAASTNDTEHAPDVSLSDPSASAAADVDDLMEAAEEFISAAADTDRSIDDRITELERALTILREIERQESEFHHPDNLAARIRFVEKELEALKLKKFFP